MPAKSRNFGLSVRPTQNNNGNYQQLYKPGSFPGTPETAIVYGGAVILLQVKLYLPIVRLAGTILSGRSFRLVQKLGAVETELISVNFVASESEYSYNLLASLGIPVFTLSPEVEIGFYQVSIGYGLLSGQEKMDVFGAAVEEVA